MITSIQDCPNEILYIIFGLSLQGGGSAQALDLALVCRRFKPIGLYYLYESLCIKSSGLGVVKKFEHIARVFSLENRSLPIISSAHAPIQHLFLGLSPEDRTSTVIDSFICYYLPRLLDVAAQTLTTLSLWNVRLPSQLHTEDLSFPLLTELTLLGDDRNSRCPGLPPPSIFPRLTHLHAWNNISEPALLSCPTLTHVRLRQAVYAFAWPPLPRHTLGPSSPIMTQTDSNDGITSGGNAPQPGDNWKVFILQPSQSLLADFREICFRWFLLTRGRASIIPCEDPRKHFDGLEQAKRDWLDRQKGGNGCWLY